MFSAVAWGETTKIDDELWIGGTQCKNSTTQGSTKSMLYVHESLNRH